MYDAKGLLSSAYSDGVAEVSETTFRPVKSGSRVSSAKAWTRLTRQGLRIRAKACVLRQGSLLMQLKLTYVLPARFTPFGVCSLCSVRSYVDIASITYTASTLTIIAWSSVHGQTQYFNEVVRWYNC
jgi:hypothetical protein